jgi:hypothetical protein
MSCRNPRSEFSAENWKTLDPKIQNYQNCSMRVVGGALREVIHPYAIFIPNVSILRFGTPQKERVIQIFGNPRRVLRFCIRERTTARSLWNGFFKTYALIPCWIFIMLGSIMRFISF